MAFQVVQHVGGVAGQEIIAGREFIAFQVVRQRGFPVALVALGVTRHEQQLGVAAIKRIQA
ncbi:hypothetical protein D3C73_1134550 [compost metagenome]